MLPSSNDQQQQPKDAAAGASSSSSSPHSSSFNHLRSHSSSVTSSPALNSNSYCYDETSLALCLQWLGYKDVLAASGVCQAWRAAAGRHDILSQLHSQSHLFITILTEAEIDRVVCTLYSKLQPISPYMSVPSMLTSLRSSPLMCHVPRIIVEWEHERIFLPGKPRKESFVSVELNIDANRTTRFQRLVKQVFDDVATLSDVNDITLDTRFLLIPGIATHPLLSRTKKLTIDLPQDWDATAGGATQSEPESESVSAVVQHVPTSTSTSASAFSLSPQLLQTTLSHCAQLTKLHIGEMLKPGSIGEGIEDKQYHMPVATDKIKQLVLPTPAPLHQPTTDSMSSAPSLPCPASLSSASVRTGVDSSLHSLPLLQSFSAFCITESSRRIIVSLLTTPLVSHLRETDIAIQGITSKQLAEICRGKLSEDGNGENRMSSLSSVGSGMHLSQLEKLQCVVDFQTPSHAAAPMFAESYASMMEDVSAVAFLPRLRVIHIKPKVNMGTNVAFTLKPLIAGLKWHRQHCQTGVRNINRMDGNGNGDGDDSHEDEDRIDLLQYLHEATIELPQPPPAPATSHEAEHSSNTAAWLLPHVPDDEKFSLPNLTEASITLTPAGPSAVALSHHAPNLKKLILHMHPSEWKASIEEYVYEHLRPPLDPDEELWLPWLDHHELISDDEENAAMRNILQRWISMQDQAEGESSSSSRSRNGSLRFAHLTELELRGWNGVYRFERQQQGERGDPEAAADLPVDSPVAPILPILTSSFPSLRRIHCHLFGDYSFTHLRREEVQRCHSPGVTTNIRNHSDNNDNDTSSGSSGHCGCKSISSMATDEPGWTLSVERFSNEFPR